MKKHLLTLTLLTGAMTAANAQTSKATTTSNTGKVSGTENTYQRVDNYNAKEAGKVQSVHGEVKSSTTDVQGTNTNSYGGNNSSPAINNTSTTPKTNTYTAPKAKSE